MMEVILLIRSGQEAFEVRLKESITIGRNDHAIITVSDAGLSNLHASIYRNAETVWIVDEHSTSGSFVNGQAVPPEGATLSDGDEILLGNHTNIFVEIRERSRLPVAQPGQARPAVEQHPPPAPPPAQAAKRASIDFRSPNFIASLSAALIMVLAAVAILATRSFKEDEKPITHARKRSGVLIQPTIREPLIDLWDVEETPLSDEQPNNEAQGRAIVKVKEDRGEAVGYEAAVEIPAELKHYSDRRRFLAIQTAEAIEQNLRIPHDFAALVQMIGEKQFIELRPVSENYVLYAAGGGASDHQFTHYERDTGISFPLYSDASEMQKALAAMAETDNRKALITSFYATPRARSLGASEYDLLSVLARDFDKRTYNLKDAASRKALKRRLLSFIRPETLKVLDELAAAYRNRFNRLLPLASLIRTEEYQRELSERNVNAARNALPPHTTGLAFDISYRYMTAAEQNFLMAEIARLEAAGRVEALRENNNCFHVFVFPDGRPPPETLITRGM